MQDLPNRPCADEGRLAVVLRKGIERHGQKAPPQNPLHVQLCIWLEDKPYPLALPNGIIL